VVDFGIAKLTAIEGDAKQSGHLTTTGSVLGTPYYMSPEQVFGDKNIDHRTDVWSLGTIAFECLSGRRPVDGDNIGQLLKVITTGAIPRLEDVISGLPPDVYELVGRMLSFDRTRRPYDLREVLNVFARHTDQHAASFGEVTLLPGAVSAPDPSVSPTAETLLEPPGVAAVSSSPPFGSTTGGASMPSAAAMAASEPQPLTPTGNRRFAAFGAVGLAVLGAAAFVGVRAMTPATGATAPPLTPNLSAVLSAPAVASAPASAAIAGEPPPSASVAVVLSASSAPVSASASSLFRRPSPPAAGRPVSPSPSTKTPSPDPTVVTPSPSAKTVPTGAPVATDNPYK
jgi:serine/threonine-protein kinase